MTTELSSLPTDPNVPNENQLPLPNKSQNTILSQETPTMYSTADLDQKRPQEMDLSDKAAGSESINSIMKQVQTAASQGMTNISKVPIHHAPPIEQHTIDPQSNTNNINNTQEIGEKHVRFADQDYISNYEAPNTQELNTDKSPVPLIYHFRTPIIVALLYYIFDMPAVKRIFLNVFPKFFKSDSNINDYGALLMAIIFGAIYYLVTKVYEGELL